MKAIRTSLFLKVVVQHDEKEKPEKLATELCRQLAKNYIVRSAELSSYSTADSGVSDESDESDS